MSVSKFLFTIYAFCFFAFTIWFFIHSLKALRHDEKSLREIHDLLDRAKRLNHAHWITMDEAAELDDFGLAHTCSRCHHCDWDCTESETFNYCPHCGAKMDEEVEA